MTEDLWIIGAGGHAGEVIDAIHASNLPFLIRGLYDDNPAFHNQPIHGYQCLGSVDQFIHSTPKHSFFFLAIGNNTARQNLAIRLIAAEKKTLTVIHPAVIVSPSARVGSGTYVAPCSTIGSRAVVGEFALVNVHASIGHDSEIASFSQLCPGVRVSGYCKVGQGAFLGSNAVLAPGKSMGPWSRLSGCSLALNDIPEGRLASGIPATVIV
ncbi:MAG: NeuD/PglB/VioB family sugar acetyltransferase [Verrucomicrobiota bacterium]|nr:NeuD/PglB/VioB family sugar acetyltransferase [Verrucomicrobiota bacterium]